MKMKRNMIDMDSKSGVIILFILISTLGVFSANGNQGKTGLSFLKVAIDARGVGMGEAYTAVTSDASAIYWNPAGLVSSKSSNVLFNHNQWIMDIRGEFAALALVRSRSAWGFHLNSFNIGDIAVREIPSSEPLSQTSAHYFSTGLSYARRVQKRLDVGLSIKYLFEKIDVYTASGFALDLGLVYRLPVNGWQMGATWQNLGRMNNLRDDKSTLPSLIRLGTAYMVPVNRKELNVLLAADLVKVSAENWRFHSGAEFLFWKQLALRGGWFLGYEARDFSLGVGFVRSSLRVDYGLIPFADDLGSFHRFTINFNL